MSRHESIHHHELSHSTTCMEVVVVMYAVAREDTGVQLCSNVRGHESVSVA